ncbi:helix-turn-helix domain-containing protein [Flavobacterium selenitireducens]|uniref:helix-turn-helix domain-containing protein n=1 Tax=Flavobacterium selenitireducens TaxID=2722704 RepID=UPI00168AE2D4|nr:LexA family transcriptional regulator [Flavobacterium selenitireducens]MBD3583287.1 LexA family transcriptional regulator [Flavobacterium selenitireducens]
MQHDISAENVKFIRKKFKETQAEFAKRIGLSRESIVKYEKGSPIPENRRSLFRALLAEIKENDGTKNLVPYFNAEFGDDVDKVSEQRPTLRPDYFMDIPEFAGCTAFRTYSDSMESKIKSGSILFGTNIEAWRQHLEYGQIYGIVCDDGRKYLKYIRRDPVNPFSNFLLQSENPAYDDFSIPKDVIRSIWLINGWLNKQT